MSRISPGALCFSLLAVTASLFSLVGSVCPELLAKLGFPPCTILAPAQLEAGVIGLDSCEHAGCGSEAGPWLRCVATRRFRPLMEKTMTSGSTLTLYLELRRE